MYIVYGFSRLGLYFSVDSHNYIYTYSGEIQEEYESKDSAQNEPQLTGSKQKIFLFK